VVTGQAVRDEQRHHVLTERRFWVKGRQGVSLTALLFATRKPAGGLATTTVSEVSALHIRQADKTNPVGSWG
jgi:hypothetical protein